MTKEKANEIEHIDDKTSTDVGDIAAEEMIDDDIKTEQAERLDENDKDDKDDAAYRVSDNDIEREAISDEEKRAALRDPMFLMFAKGRTQGIDEIISDFCAMLRAAGREERISVKARMTPTSGAVSPEYALSERQRRIARDAGMSYREYYGFLKSMKNI